VGGGGKGFWQHNAKEENCRSTCAPFRRISKAPKTAAQTWLSGTDLWWIGHIPIFRHARIDINISGRFAVKAGVHSWVVIPLIPKDAFPFHLASLDIDPAAKCTFLVKSWACRMTHG